VPGAGLETGESREDRGSIPPPSVHQSIRSTDRFQVQRFASALSAPLPLLRGKEPVGPSMTQSPPVNIGSFEGPAGAVARYYPELLQGANACLAVFGAMALSGRTKPLSLIFEAASGFGKTAIVQMAFPLAGSALDQYAYRSDKFTPKAFVTHAANIKKDELAQIDLLPKLNGKVLLTKELAPLFRGREEDLKDNFSILISVLDGKGFTSDSGTHGRRGYSEPVLFNWIGATTPLPPSTHRLMSQLGTRLLFYELPAIAPTEEQLLAYAKRDEADAAENECQRATNEFLVEFFSTLNVGSIPPETITFSEQQSLELVRWARLLVAGRAEVHFEKTGTNWEPVAAMPAEGPWKVVQYFKDLARGHAVVHYRADIDDSDLALVAEVALSSIPGNIRPIVRRLRETGTLDTPMVEKLCRVTSPTARNYIRQLGLLGIADLRKGKPDAAMLAPKHQWLNQANSKSIHRII